MANDMTVATDGAEVEVTDQTEVDEAAETQAETQGTTQEAEEAFYDASKVAPELQASFKEMQAAFTKKTQEIAAWKQLQDFGSPEEISGFVQQFMTDEGLFSWWVRAAKEFGVPEEKVLSLFSDNGEIPQQTQQQAQQAQQSQGTEKTEPRYLTEDEFNRRFSEIQDQQTRVSADSEVVDVMNRLQIPEDVRPIVAQLGSRYPMHLGYEKRIQLGYKQFQGLMDKQVSTILEKKDKAANTTPKSLAGSSPALGQSRESDSIQDATKAAAAFLAANDSA